MISPVYGLKAVFPGRMLILQLYNRLIGELGNRAIALPAEVRCFTKAGGIV